MMSSRHCREGHGAGGGGSAYGLVACGFGGGRTGASPVVEEHTAGGGLLAGVAVLVEQVCGPSSSRHLSY